jgi:nicotinamidase/pyrazinamidase
MKSALIIVDPQLDFMPGGSLAVAEGDQIVPMINDIKKLFEVVVVTRDWHPIDHACFTTINGKKVLETTLVHGEQMIVWPPHCLQHREGAQFHPDLELKDVPVFTKGDNKYEHPFSAFSGRLNDTYIVDFLKEQEVTDVWVVGLAGDFCVKSTAIDAVKYFKTHFLLEGTRFICSDSDIPKHLKEMEDLGIDIVKKFFDRDEPIIL